MRVLVVDDKEFMRDSIAATLTRAGLQVAVAPDGNAAARAIADRRPDVVLTDLQMPGMTGLELLAEVKRLDEQIPVVLMTAFATVQTAVEAMKIGAFDYIMKPFDGDRLEATVMRAAEHARLVRENAVLETRLESSRSGAAAGPLLVGESEPMRRLCESIARIAQSQGTVLVCGESGVGKEVVAQTIHAHSPRAKGPMLSLNCAALSASLLESELFGHEKGAFTGADRLRKGRFELADGGTLLLDEISEIAPQIQAKLLRVLQERAFERVGSSLTQRTDVRVIATTNRDLQASVAAGAFRQDLFFRLNVLPLHVPALRERCEDVPLLCDHFLGLVARREGRPSKRFDDRALAVLRSYAWPGNVRELYNVCERASIFTPGEVIDATTIAPWLNVAVPAMPRVAPVIRGSFPQRRETTSIATPSAASNQAVYAPIVDGPALESHGGLPEHANSRVGDGTGNGALAPTLIDPKIHIATIGRPLEDIERDVIVATLQRHNGHRQRTARELQIGIRTLGLKLRKWKDLKLVSEDL